MRRMTWGTRIFLFSVSLVLGGILALLSNAVMAETNTVSSTITGTTTVDKTPPTASAPSIVINNQDVCTSASSVAVQTQILGFATGQTVTDENCERLKLARSLYGMGMKVAAVSVLCQDQRVWTGMMMAGTPCPYLGSIGDDAKRKWEDNNYEPPTFEPKPVEEIVQETLPPVEGKEESDADFAVSIGAIAALLLLL
jgi:hypothetical protein